MNIGLYILLALGIVFFGYTVFSIIKLKKAPAVAENQNIINLDEKNFLQTTKNSVALIDFWADWCMPCKMMTPVLNEVAGEVDENVKICKVNVDTQQSLASKFSVRSIPTLVLMKNGKEVNRFVGIKQKDFLLKQINQLKN